MYVNKAIWYESKYYENRDNVPDTEIPDTEGYSPFLYNEIQKKKVNTSIQGIRIEKHSRVIETNAFIDFKRDDRIEFPDGRTLTIQEVYARDSKPKVNLRYMSPNIKKLNTIWTLYLK